MPKILYLLCLLISLSISIDGKAQGTSKKKEKFPSYFGLHVRPLFPTRFIGEPTTVMNLNEFNNTIQQKMGYSFGATVRAGITKLIAFETGINYTQRYFDIDMSVPDSNVFAKNDLSFIAYDIPVNGLVYIQLSEKFYMNTSLGLAVTFKPTDVGILTLPGGYHSFRHTGRVRSKVSFDLNANVGFEYRTEKSGFFYIGGSGRVPFMPLFTAIATYKYQGYTNTIYADVDGSYLAIDFKYFLPHKANRGPQWQRGPIL